MYQHFLLCDAREAAAHHTHTHTLHTHTHTRKKERTHSGLRPLWLSQILRSNLKVRWCPPEDADDETRCNFLSGSHADDGAWWPKWPPGVTNSYLNVILSALRLSLSVSCSLKPPRPLASLWPWQWNSSRPFLWGPFFLRHSQRPFFTFWTKLISLLLSRLGRPAGAAGLVFSSFPPSFLSPPSAAPSLIYCEAFFF